MWNISASSAAESSDGSTKKLRENTSNARCRARSGNRTWSRKAAAPTPSSRAYTSGTRTSRSGSAAAASSPASSRRPKLGLSVAKPRALSGGVRGTWRKLSRVPSRPRSG